VDDVLAPGLADDTDLWVIGGGAVYAAFLPHADRLVVTDVDLDVPGDTWAPPIAAQWAPVARDPADGWHASSTGPRYAVTTYARRSAPGRAG
jgi:dihydrofolate reductase